MKLVVDTNIIFSAILNEKSRIASILINYHSQFELYSSSYLKTELTKYYPKLSHLSSKSIDEIERIESLVCKNIRFIDIDILPKPDILQAKNLLHNIDMNDLFFVALTNYLKATLWTGDKKLIKGLKSKNYKHVISTEDLIETIRSAGSSIL